ncbi:MAG: translation initiation factor IF-6 [Promethearchaeota archaeon]
MLERLNILGNPAIGISCCITDAYYILPGNVKEHVLKATSEIFNVPRITLDISIRMLVGVMFVGNSKGLLIPNHLSPNDEEKVLDAMSVVPGVEVRVLEESKLNALGNLVATNDHGAVISRKFEDDVIAPIEETLKVPVVKKNLSSSPLVGTRIVANSHGCVVSPLATNEEAESLKSIFKVDNVDFTTVCLGMEAIRVGMLANSHGAIVGDSTSGPEMARISDVLGV